MTFGSMQVADMAEIFADSDGPAEAVSWIGKPDSQPTAINAVIERFGRDENQDEPGTYEVQTIACNVLISAVADPQINDLAMIPKKRGSTELVPFRVDSISFTSASTHRLIMMAVDKTRLSSRDTESNHQGRSRV